MRQNDKKQKKELSTFADTPIKGMFGKLERPKFDIYGTDTNDEKNAESAKKQIIVSKLYYKGISGFFIVILILGYLIPEDVLNIRPLRYFVDCVSLIVPHLNNIDQHSTFPEATKLIYSLCIVSIPLQVLLVHKLLGTQLASFLREKSKDELNIVYWLFIFFFIITILFIYILPLIGPRSSLMVRHYNTVKVSFSIITSLAFFLNAAIVSIIISCRNKIHKFNIKNN